MDIPTCLEVPASSWEALASKVVLTSKEVSAFKVDLTSAVAPTNAFAFQA